MVEPKSPRHRGMAELYFLRHGQRIDHALQEDSSARPLLEEYQPYDPSLAESAIGQIEKAANDIIALTKAFEGGSEGDNITLKKNIFIHFSPYLRCCQLADLLITSLKAKILAKWPNYKIRFQLLGDFALSEWIHEKMKDKPPFVDSNDAYNMYIPNVKQLKNKSCCSTFRPTITLGHFNGPNLSYKDYQHNVKTYFKKLVATYDKPSFINNEDIIVVMSHGYVINNFLSYFINHPIFDEIPEAAINFARRDGDDKTWTLFKDSLGILEKDKEVNSALNLETDIIYYMTNFIKKDDYFDQNAANGLAATASTEESENNNREDGMLHVPRPNLEPRTSFKVKSALQAKTPTTYICNAARDWTPELSKKLLFKIKSEFKKKVMKDDSFKKTFDLSHHPSKPVTPEVSPTLEPTRSNSVIDLSKLLSNNEIYNPMKLKYSHAGDIPIHRLNSKVNSQVNLAALNRTPSQPQKSNNSSSNSSAVDLPKYLSSVRRERSASNPPLNVTVSHNAKDSYFPSTIVSKMSSPSDSADEDLHIIKESNEPLMLNRSGRGKKTDEESDPNYNSVLGDLNRARSLNHKKSNTTGKSLLAKYKQTQGDDDSGSNNSSTSMNSRLFSLGISNYSNSSNYFHAPKKTENNATKSSPTQPARLRSRKNSLKFIPSVLKENDGKDAAKKPDKKKHIFYNLDSDGSNSGSESDSESSKSPSEARSGQYVWFGQNNKDWEDDV